jgi:hypothetical protein
MIEMLKKQYYYLVPILLIIVYIVYVVLKTSLRKPTVDIVISRYEEDLSWLNKIKPSEYSKLYIYNKGSPISVPLPNVHMESLPNLGRESHTYFHHVINNYNNLADMTFFLPGSLWALDSKKLKFFRILSSIKSDFRSTILGHTDKLFIDGQRDFTIDSYTITNEENRKNNPDTSLHRSDYRPLNKWFTKHFPKEEPSCISFNGIMAVTQESIQKHPIEFYQNLLAEHSFKNAEVVHYSERTWKNIFSIDNCIPE